MIHQGHILGVVFLVLHSGSQLHDADKEQAVLLALVDCFFEVAMAEGLEQTLHTQQCLKLDLRKLRAYLFLMPFSKAQGLPAARLEGLLLVACISQ